MNRPGRVREPWSGATSDDPERHGQGQPSQTRKLIIGLHDQIVALTGAIRALDERVPSRVVSVEQAAHHLSVSVGARPARSRTCAAVATSASI